MDRLTPAALIATALLFTAGCATNAGVTKRSSLTIEVYHVDGRLQWRQTVINEHGTGSPPGANERIGK